MDSPYIVCLELSDYDQLLLCCAAPVAQTPGRILTEVRDLKGCSAWAFPASQETLCPLLRTRLAGSTFLIFWHRVTGLVWPHHWDRSWSRGSTGGRSASLAPRFPLGRALLCLGCSWGHRSPRREQGWEAEGRQRWPPARAHLSQGEDRG